MNSSALGNELMQCFISTSTATTIMESFIILCAYSLPKKNTFSSCVFRLLDEQTVMVVDLTKKLEKYEEELAIVQTEKVRARFAQISVLLQSLLAHVKTAQMRKSLH